MKSQLKNPRLISRIVAVLALLVLSSCFDDAGFSAGNSRVAGWYDGPALREMQQDNCKCQCDCTNPNAPVVRSSGAQANGQPCACQCDCRQPQYGGSTMQPVVPVPSIPMPAPDSDQYYQRPTYYQYPPMDADSLYSPYRGQPQYGYPAYQQPVAPVIEPQPAQDADYDEDYYLYYWDQ